MQTNQHQGPDPSGRILAGIAIAAATLGGLYLGAQLAALAVHRQLVRSVSLDSVIHFARHLPQHWREPSQAWPPEVDAASLTGPIPFWASTIIVWLTMIVVAVKLSMLIGGDRKVGQRRETRFGAPAWSREATRADLGPLIVTGPTPGRTIFGTSHGQLVATENRKPKRREHQRQGDRGGVLVVGPARSGKTVIAVGAILEHDWGPLIASSVKTDLLAATIKRRSALDDVAIFDPLNSTEGLGNIGWSPLTQCRTSVGAQSIANNLIAAAPSAGTAKDHNFWTEQAVRLAWALLYTAAIGEKTMRDVVIWAAAGPKIRKGAPGIPTDKHSQLIHQTLLNAANVEDHADDAELALTLISGLWGEAPETCSSVYAATQILFKPWEDTRIAKNSRMTEVIDLDWLLGGHGRRSLYVCMPAKPGEPERFAIVFGGLISTLTDAAYERRNRENKPLPNILLVLDEAGNTAATWLPSLSTTCASVGVTLMTFWQSLAQISYRYGEQTNTLITNHTTKIFFGGISDVMSGETAGKLAGSQEVVTQSATQDRTISGRHSTTENTAAVPLVSADLVRQIKPFEALCIHGTLQPIHLRARKWWRDRDLNARAKAKRLPERSLAGRLKPYAIDPSVTDGDVPGRGRAAQTTGFRTVRRRTIKRHPSIGTASTQRDASQHHFRGRHGNLHGEGEGSKADTQRYLTKHADESSIECYQRIASQLRLRGFQLPIGISSIDK
jgi:type IV secretion system protein VirD4